MVSTRALLLVLENIESNVELDDKPHSKEAKGADSKRKIELNNSQVPWTEKHCIHCNKHGGTHTTHNTRECCCYKRDGTPKKAGGTPNSKQLVRGKEGMNFAQVICAECKKEVHTALKKSYHGKRHHSHHEDSDSDSDSDY